MTLTHLFSEFIESEKNSGFILVACTIVSLLVANSHLGEAYLHFWHMPLNLSFLNVHLNFTIEHWINDGLMTIFFLLVGLEIEREIYIGELTDPRNALLPICAALGGMVVPALFHLYFNIGTVTQSGMGIPMATDIAFCLAALSLLGDRVPSSLKMFLVALAIIDDLGSVIIITLFYSREVSFFHLGLSIAIFATLIVLNRLKVTRLALYIIPGMVMWYFMMKSGIHATVAGILLAFAVPFTADEESCPSRGLQHYLHVPVSFLILPVFALANTVIVVTPGWMTTLLDNNSLGIIGGLVLGKPLGILAGCWIAVRGGFCKVPDDLTFRHLAGAGILAGIGFTMAIFVATLAFADAALISSTKIAILAASLVAGMTGIALLATIPEATKTKA